MGYFGKLEEKFKAQELRRKGFSYKEILKHIDVSKDTISRWCRDISLSEEQKERLVKNKEFGQKKGSLVAAENKRAEREERMKKIFWETKKELGKMSTRDRFITGIALYAAEGGKTDGQGEFANSDPQIISFMMDWFKLFVKVPQDRIRGAVWLHEGLDEVKAREYWSSLTGIPLAQFHKTYIAKNKIESKKIRKNIHELGVFSIRFSDSEKQRKIMGWISALLNAKIKQ
jgi:transcriptional regulator with XRE-family HTH domain